jgi:transposase
MPAGTGCGPSTGCRSCCCGLRAQRFDRVGVQLAFDEAFDAVLCVHARRDRLDGAIVEMAAASGVAPLVDRLCCLRGIGTLTGFGLAVEVADWQRFTGATIASYLGLVPCESSSGARRSQGGITKAGNSHARRLLVEAAQNIRVASPQALSAQPGAVGRRNGQPPAVRDRAEQGNRRLHRWWARLDARGKRSIVSAVAVARELAGWAWSLAVMDSAVMDSAVMAAEASAPDQLAGAVVTGECEERPAVHL